LYVDALREKDIRKRIAIKAKIEDREKTVRTLRQQTFAEYVTERDKEYRDRVFWMVENSNITYEEVKRLTLEERVNLEYRINRKINDQNRRNRAGDSGL